MAVPSQLPTIAQNETFGGVTFHVEGELVPVLHLELKDVPVYFEHHILLWKDPAVEIGLKPLKGAVPRLSPGGDSRERPYGLMRVDVSAARVVRRSTLPALGKPPRHRVVHERRVAARYRDTSVP